jgi:hypothetical protein
MWVLIFLIWELLWSFKNPPPKRIFFFLFIFSSCGVKGPPQIPPDSSIVSWERTLTSPPSLILTQERIQGLYQDYQDAQMEYTKTQSAPPKTQKKHSCLTLLALCDKIINLEKNLIKESKNYKKQIKKLKQKSLLPRHESSPALVEEYLDELHYRYQTPWFIKLEEQVTTCFKQNLLENDVTHSCPRK